MWLRLFVNTPKRVLTKESITRLGWTIIVRWFEFDALRNALLEPTSKGILAVFSTYTSGKKLSLSDVYLS